REAFELLKRRLEEEPYLGYLGAGIFVTGGCRLLKGIGHLAPQIFEITCNPTHAHPACGGTSALENPQFSSAIGLVKFAQVMHTDRPPRRFGRLIGKIFSGKR